MKSSRLAMTAVIAAALLFVGRGAIRADDTQGGSTPAQTNNPPAKTNNAPAQPTPEEKPPPLPLHQIEGSGGIFSTLSAYLVNPPRSGECFGRPSLGFSYVNIGHGQNLEALTITETPWERLELGYAWDRLDLGDLPQAIQTATTVNISPKEIYLHNFNARLQLLKEGEFGQKWLPAITFGSDTKYNQNYQEINQELGGALKKAGITHDTGEDLTLYASKMFTLLPRPVLVELGGRATEGVWNGLAGFTSHYDVLFEGNVVAFLFPQVALAFEYRQQPNQYKPIDGLVHKEGDWWTVDAAYVVNSHLTLAAGYGHFGYVLNHQANGVWGLTTKWEF
ncbi:MAG TPA: DUF3034 family protein [Candidatus Binataceae bacterium]|nr:DUF3034 family protein [Candidatus Binataceae bacterium]